MHRWQPAKARQMVGTGHQLMAIMHFTAKRQACTPRPALSGQGLTISALDQGPVDHKTVGIDNLSVADQGQLLARNGAPMQPAAITQVHLGQPARRPPSGLGPQQQRAAVGRLAGLIGEGQPVINAVRDQIQAIAGGLRVEADLPIDPLIAPVPSASHWPDSATVSAGLTMDCQRADTPAPDSPR